MTEWKDRELTADGSMGRARVVELLRSDIESAEATARWIRHPWYRCQALTYVAEATSDEAGRGRLLAAAVKAATELSEPNRRVTAGSMPLAVLARTESDDRLEREMERLIEDASTEPHTLRRLSALWAILDAVWAQRRLRERVLDSFLSTALVSHGRGRDRIVSKVAERLGQSGDPWARDVAEMVEKSMVWSPSA